MDGWAGGAEGGADLTLFGKPPNEVVLTTTMVNIKYYCKFLNKRLFINYVSCLYAKCPWLISNVQLSFQSLLVNLFFRLTCSRGDMIVAVRILKDIYFYMR